MTDIEIAQHHWDRHGAAIVHEFAELVSLPNVSADRAAIAAVASWIVEAFQRRDVAARTVQLGDAPPVVVGRVDGDPDGPTIGIYAHYDGQPVAPERWSSPPFEPTLRTARLEDGGALIRLPSDAPIDDEWRLYARGTADDRAPIAALLGALDAGGPRLANVILLFEGEEEVGSPHLGDYLTLLSDELSADIWLICDGPVHQSGRPQIALGVRGFAEMEVKVFGPPHDLHSGHYGETAVNPIVALAEILTSLRDSDGVLRPGVLAGSEPETGALEAAGRVPEPVGLGFAMNPAGSYAARLLEPLLNVRGVASADVGPASRNVIPAEATASIDLRLPAGFDPSTCIDAIRSHVEALGYHLVEESPTSEERMEHRLLARVTGKPGYPGVRTDPNDPMVRVIAAAVATVAETSPILLPSFGGSVPLHHFVENLDAPLAIVPIANHDNNQHSADENLRLGNLRYGVAVMSALLGVSHR